MSKKPLDWFKASLVVLFAALTLLPLMKARKVTPNVNQRTHWEYL